MKKILIVSWYPASGADSGERIRLSNLVKYLESRHDVTLYSFANDRQFDRLQSYRDIRAGIQIPYKFGILDWSRAFLQRRSIQEIKLPSSRNARKELKTFLLQNTFDIVIANQLPSICLLLKVGFPTNSVVYLDSHNAEKLRIERILSNLSWAKRKLLNFQVKSAERIEKKSCNASQLVIAVSKQDFKYFESFDTCHVILAENGSENKFSVNPYRLKEASDFLRLVFLGSLSYSANREGLIKFMTDFDNSKYKNFVKVVIGGSGAPDKFVEKINGFSNAEYFGYVRNPEEFLLSGDAMLVPLWLGGGSRLKVFEGFAHGMPIISTPIGVEGIEVVNRIHYLEFNSIEEFDAVIASILGDKKILSEISENAFDLSSNNSWSDRFHNLSRYIDSI